MKKIIVVLMCSFTTCSIAMADANSIAQNSASESAAAINSSADKIAFTLEGDFFSRYIWRGQVISNGAVFQPSVAASYKGWTANVWSDIDLTGYRGERDEFAEFDLTLDYSNKLTEKIGYSIGVIHYHFPSFSAVDTTELYWGFNFDVPLSPAIKIYHGLGNENGTYVNLSIGQTYEKVLTMGKDTYCNLQWGIALGWANGTYNKDYWGVNGSRFNDLTFSLGLPINFPGGWVVKPNISYITLVDGAIRSSDVYARSSDYLVTGVNIIKTF